MKIIREEMLVKAAVDVNSNKFYRAQLLEDFTVQIYNGRIGSEGQKQPPKSFSSEAAAVRFLESKLREKEKGGYKPFQGVATTKTKSGASRLALEMAASEQIRTRDKDRVIDLIKRLVQANVHSILKSTDLKYDDETGVFQTPLGIVTQETINEARDLLQKLGRHIEVQDFDSADVKALLASYLMLIPQKVGRQLTVKGVLPDQDSIQKQSGILDDLESSIAQVAVLRQQQAQAQQTATPAPIEKIFNCEINVVTDQSVIDEIAAFFKKGAKSMHASYGYKIKTVYELTIDSMTKAFEERGKKVGNIERMWHGTRPGNLLSILKSGLVVPPSSSSWVSGRAFGDGLYGSFESTKSLNYSTGWWAGKVESQCFMFLIDMALGKTHIANKAWEKYPKPGTDSTTALPGKSGVANSELICYDKAQVCPRFLIEFEQ